MTFVLYYNSALTFRYLIHFGELYAQNLERKSHVLTAILNIACVDRLKPPISCEVPYALYVRHIQTNK